jgi:hypothetical protein
VSGEAAAWLLDGSLRPETITLYGADPLEDVARILGATPSDEGAIELLIPFWADEKCPGAIEDLADPDPDLRRPAHTERPESQRRRRLDSDMRASTLREPQNWDDKWTLIEL